MNRRFSLQVSSSAPILSSAFPALLIGAAALVGCSFHAGGGAKGASDTSQSAASCENDASSHASAKADGGTSSQGNVHVSSSGNAHVEGNAKTDIRKRVVFQTKPRVVSLARAKTDTVFVGAHGIGTGKLHGSINVAGTAKGSGSLKGGGTAKGGGTTETDGKGQGAAVRPPKDTVKKPGLARPAKPGKKPSKGEGTKTPVTETPKTPVTETPKTPVTETPKTPVTETPKTPDPAPLPAPIDPPAAPPENVFGYEKPIRGCFEGLVYFIPANSTALPKSYEGLTSSSALYACEWDIPTRAWEQGFPGLEDRFEWFAIRYSGAFSVSTAGSWKFRISSDDGTRLLIDDKLVIENDGVHGPREASGTVDLAAGDHTMVLEYFQGPRYHINLQLFATPPGGSEGIFSVR